MKPQRLVLSDALAYAAKPAAKEYQIYDRTVSGLQLRVHPTGAKSWVLRHRREGKLKRITLGQIQHMPIAEARAKAHAYLAANMAPIIPAKAKGPRFADVAALYIERRADHWKPSTRRAQLCYLHSTLIPFFADMPIGTISRTDVGRWFHDYGRTRPGGANRALAVLSDLFNRAKSWDLLDEARPNPTKGIKKNRREPKGRLLDKQQIKRLGIVLDRYALIHEDSSDAVRLMLLTGCRSGEILNLRWEEVKVDRLQLLDSKAGARDVLLGRPAAALLQRRRRNRHGDYVFPSPPNPTRPRGSIRAFWNRVREEAHLGHLRLHDLRHTYASHAVMRGETLFMTGQLLGHRNATTTERYAHLADRFLLDAAERVASAILEQCRGS